MNGRAHGMATKIGSPIVGVAIAFVTKDIGLGIAAATGCLLGLIIDPDLDCNSTIDRMNASRWRMMQLWKPLGYIWFVIWWPYGRLFYHRGISHTPLIGTLTRILYLLFVPILVSSGAIMAGYDLTMPLMDLQGWLRGHALHFFVALFGLCLSDFAHWVMDKV